MFYHFCSEIDNKQNSLNNAFSLVEKRTKQRRSMLLKDKIVQMNTGFKGPKLVLLKERLGTQVFLLLNEINLDSRTVFLKVASLQVLL